MRGRGECAGRARSWPRLPGSAASLPGAWLHRHVPGKPVTLKLESHSVLLPQIVMLTQQSDFACFSLTMSTPHILSRP